MTYEERLKYYCEQSCHDRQQCGYVGRGMIGDCTYLQDIMTGWEAGYQDAIDKAAEYIKEHLFDYWSQSVTDESKFIEEFKKNMED